MSQETIARIFTIEKAAAKMHSDAQQQAAELVAEAEKAAISIRDHSVKLAQQEAERIIATGERHAEVENARIIAQAGADAQRFDTIAAKNLDLAVDFVLARVMGQA
jgi:vacuolar-type H+-ATPase subunit H